MPQAGMAGGDWARGLKNPTPRRKSWQFEVTRDVNYGPRADLTCIRSWGVFDGGP